MSDVLIVHGWAPRGGDQSLWNSVYGGLKSGLELAGITVHGPLLPKNGNTAGDTIFNAQAVVQYMIQHNLHDVVLVGHSLGGMVVGYLVRYLDRSRVRNFVTLDSAVHEWPGAQWPFTKLFGILINPPDQWAGSAVRNLIAGQPWPADTEHVNVWATSTYKDADASFDCNIRVTGSHTSMVGNPITIDIIEQVVAGVRPC